MTTLEIEDNTGDTLTLYVDIDDPDKLIVRIIEADDPDQPDSQVPNSLSVYLNMADATHLHAYLATWIMRQSMERARRTMEEEE